MMAENTDNNVPEKTRRSMDNPYNFIAENTIVQREASIADVSTKHECAISTKNVNENQRQDRFRAAWDMGTSDDMSSGRSSSFSSICSFDSGYASRKNTVSSIVSEDEQTKLCQLQIRPAAQTESTPKI